MVPGEKDGACDRYIFFLPFKTHHDIRVGGFVGIWKKSHGKMVEYWQEESGLRKHQRKVTLSGKMINHDGTVQGRVLLQEENLAHS